jgi:acetylserotonin N-methyltransferase
VLDLIEAFRRSKVMFAAVELGIFDALRQGPADSHSLSQRLGCNPRALLTLLESCVCLGLLDRCEDQFSNTDSAAAYLTSTSPTRLTGYIRYSNNVMWKMWASLEAAVRSGDHQWKNVYGLDGPIFSHFFRTPEAMHEFLMGMHGFGMITSPVIVKAIDLSRFGCMCDLGGATGHWLMAALAEYPELQGILFDLPHALDLGRQLLEPLINTGRVSIVGGDFFSDPLPSADLYALGRIVHDWSEDKVLKLLSKVYDALPNNGAVMIGEKMINPERSGPSWALMQSLNMLIVTEGQERSAAEYSSLLKRVGFRSIEFAVTPAPLDCILAFK